MQTLVVSLLGDGSVKGALKAKQLGILLFAQDEMAACARNLSPEEGKRLMREVLAELKREGKGE